MNIKISLLFINIMSISVAYAQYKPSAYGNGVKINFIRTWEAKRPLSSPQNVVNNTNASEVHQTTNYLDGVGRSIQSVKRQFTPSQKDLVQPHVYDPSGRESYSFPEFASASSNGALKIDAFGEHATFFAGYLNGQGQTYFYQQTNFEPSPIEREKEILFAGNSWVGANRGIAKAYEINVEGEVRKWQVSDISGSVPVSSGFYPAGEIYRFISTDEHGKRVVEYKNKEDEIILRKLENSTSGSSNISSHNGWLCTYYVYDALNNLRWIIQPVGVEALATSYGWTFDNTNLSSSLLAKEQCFYNEYDARKRLTVKKSPGAGAEEMVYDGKDRLVMHRHANLAAQGYWNVYKYDNLNRISQIYLVPNSSSRVSNQNSVNSNSNFPSVNASQLMQENYYDTYSWMPSTPPAGISATINTADYWNAFFNMNFNVAPEYAQPVTPDYANVKGKKTGTKFRILGTINYLYSVVFYDGEGRQIQEKVSNISGGYDIKTIQYDFSGRPIRMLHRQDKQGNLGRFTRELTKFNYDHAGRITSVTKKVGASGVEKSIKTHSYDELGRVSDRVLGASLETQSFRYTVRGWSTGMNVGFARGNYAGSFFGYSLSYHEDPVIWGSSSNYPQYNGNISGTIWKTKGSVYAHSYDFEYDGANRLKNAAYLPESTLGYLGGPGFYPTYGTYNLDYDANGNMQSMFHYGRRVDFENAVIDDLQYSYLPLSNKLAKVTDTVTDLTSNFEDFKDNNKVGDDYTYDEMGNLVSDKNKGITSTLYTHLNMPYEVRVQGKGKISYTYDNLGNLLKKTVVDSTVNPVRTNTWLYLDNFVYKNDTLQYFTHEEGRARYDVTEGTAEAKKFDLDFYLKDQVGNVRVVVTEKKDTIKYDALTFEGVSNSQEQIKQDQIWENKSGQSINIVNSRISRPGSFGDNNSNGQYAMLVRKSTGAIGGAKLLRVMAGDRIHTQVDYFYTAVNANNTNADGSQSFLANIADMLTNTPNLSPMLKSNTSYLSSYLSNYGFLLGILNTENNTSGANNAPKAYLNILFFDDHFVFDDWTSMVIPVDYLPNQKGTISRMFANALTAMRNGYVYVYFSNESDEMVYFDNFQLSHERGPVLEETHYYPFGLKIAGLSSKAFDKNENKIRLNSKEMQNKEFSDGTGIEWYDYGARMYDPQVGRWNGIDPLAEKYANMTPYNFVANSPMNGFDPDGKDIIFLNDSRAVMNLPGTTFDIGHAAVIIGNPKDGWYYYSMNGTGEGQSPVGTSMNPDIGTPLGFSMDFNELIKNANTINPKEQHHYDRYVHVSTTPEEDKMMMESAKRAASSKVYCVIGSSCLDVQKASWHTLAYNRVGLLTPLFNRQLYSTPDPNSFLNMLPGTMNKMNWYITNISGGTPLKSGNKRAVIVVYPLEDITPKN